MPARSRPPGVSRANHRAAQPDLKPEAESLKPASRQAVGHASTEPPNLSFSHQPPPGPTAPEAERPAPANQNPRRKSGADACTKPPNRCFPRQPPRRPIIPEACSLQPKACFSPSSPPQSRATLNARHRPPIHHSSFRIHHSSFCVPLPSLRSQISNLRFPPCNPAPEAESLGLPIRTLDASRGPMPARSRPTGVSRANHRAAQPDLKPEAESLEPANQNPRRKSGADACTEPPNWSFARPAPRRTARPRV
jgi:hypothetical protein